MSQKLENLLNLALDADQGERERSEELDVGYDKEENVWELIVKYSGTLEAVRQTARSIQQSCFQIRQTPSEYLRFRT